jgi:phosphate transport system permease protein
MMILPIISSISRELFLAVPPELKEAALGLGTTRWEMVRGVVLPYARGGVAAAMILGLGRALGEAVAVALVVGSGFRISANLFDPGNTAGGTLANNYQGASSGLELSSLIYLALILLVFSLVVNVFAQVIVRRVMRWQGLAIR